MDTKPEVEASQKEINEWYQLQIDLAKLKQKELELRLKIFGTFFKEPKEGSSTVPFSDGWVLKAEYPINRTFDVAALTTLLPTFREAHLPVKELIRNKPELSLSNYRKLSDEQRKLFDQALVIKPGTPQLEFVIPKRPTAP